VTTSAHAIAFRRAIKACGMTQQEAADYVGYSIFTVKSWSLGRRSIPDAVWDKLSDLHQKLEAAAKLSAENRGPEDPFFFRDARQSLEALQLPKGSIKVAEAMAIKIASSADED